MTKIEKNVFDKFVICSNNSDCRHNNAIDFCTVIDNCIEVKMVFLFWVLHVKDGFGCSVLLYLQPRIRLEFVIFAVIGP